MWLQWAKAFAISASASALSPLTPRLAITASSAGTASRICARICSSITARTPSSFASPRALFKKIRYVIPDSLEYKDAALVEPLACAVRGLDESNLHPGDTFAVMGLGPIGLMFVRLAKYAYGARVIAIARRIEQVDRAMMLGADEGILLATACAFGRC